MQDKKYIKTEKIYENESYIKEFNAEVLDCIKIQDGYEAVLDRTAFFPEGGGQQADKGTLEGIEVIDVAVRDDIVYHRLQKPVDKGILVKGVIDWRTRFSNMQQHSGEHILSGVIHNRFGYDNVGFHMGSEAVTLDINGIMTQEDIDEVEKTANKAIWENRDITIMYPLDKELKELEYRSKIDIDGQVRIVKIDGYDMCACCAPHVSKTAEIGLLKIIGWQNYKGGVRISMLCGDRAMNDFVFKHNIITQLSGILSAKPEIIAETVQKMQRNIMDLKYNLGKFKEEKVLEQINNTQVSGNNICLFESDIDANVMRTAVNAMVQKYAGFCGIFVGDEENGYKYIIGSKDRDSRVMGNILKEKFESRGGGSAAMIQGQLSANKEEIEKIFLNL